MRPLQPPSTETRPPKLVAPAGACDCHIHIYGPPNYYPLAPERNYNPDPHSTLDDYLKTHRVLGLERAVIVTGSANGTNNQVTLDALARTAGKFKGLALLDPAATRNDLTKLKNAGFTGFRLKSNGKGGLSFAQAGRMIDAAEEFGWHGEFLSDSMTEAIAAVPMLNKLKVDYVFDHLAHAGPGMDQTHTEFNEVLRIIRGEEHAWINLYGFYQLSGAGPPHYNDMVPVVRAIIETRPDRVIWGSNWPHAGIKVPMPIDADLLDFILTAVPEEKIRRAILTDNPARLYGWPEIL